MTGAQLQCKLGKDGSFQATILSGEYDWSVSNPPEGVYLRAVLQNEADITCHRLTLDEEQSTTGVRLMFSRGAGTVKGQVANVRPRTAEKLVVHAIPVTIKKNPCAALHRFVVASPDGNFVLSGLAPGKYYLLVVPADEHASSNFADLESIARFIDGPSLKKKQRVRVQTGETVTNVRVVLALKAPEK